MKSGSLFGKIFLPLSFIGFIYFYSRITKGTDLCLFTSMNLIVLPLALLINMKKYSLSKINNSFPLAIIDYFTIFVFFKLFNDISMPFISFLVFYYQIILIISSLPVVIYINSLVVVILISFTIFIEVLQRSHGFNFDVLSSLLGCVSIFKLFLSCSKSDFDLPNRLCCFYSFVIFDSLLRFKNLKSEIFVIKSFFDNGGMGILAIVFYALSVLSLFIVDEYDLDAVILYGVAHLLTVIFIFQFIEYLLPCSFAERIILRCVIFLSVLVFIILLFMKIYIKFYIPVRNESESTFQETNVDNRATAEMPTNSE